ncbi:MAG: beta-lactamase family protein [Anaerolineae bacterium]|nr:beta-lactamase family protein [Anaerolineae bacterium]
MLRLRRFPGYTLLLLLALLAAVPAHAQYSVRRNQALMSLWSAQVNPDGYGVALLIEMADGSQYRVAAGYASLEAQTRLRVEDRFRIGSLTKTFTATLALQLVDQGVLSLDQPVTGWLPADLAADLPNADQITLRQLLNHTAGLFNYVRHPDYRRRVRTEPEHAWTAAETLRYALDRAPEFDPGTGWQYSNSHYNLLQIVLENASGLSMERLLERQIVQYLGLPGTRWETAASLGEGIIQGYGDYDRDGRLENRTLWNDGVGLAGYAGIISSSDDLVTFMQALFGGRLLSPARLRDMLTGVPTTEGEHIRYGAGVYVNDDAMGLRVGHTGRTAGFSAQMWYLPQQEVSLVIFTNNYHTPVSLLNSLVIDSLNVVLGG